MATLDDVTHVKVTSIRVASLKKANGLGNWQVLLMYIPMIHTFGKKKTPPMQNEPLELFQRTR